LHQLRGAAKERGSKLVRDLVRSSSAAECRTWERHDRGDGGLSHCQFDIQCDVDAGSYNKQPLSNGRATGWPSHYIGSELRNCTRNSDIWWRNGKRGASKLE